MITNNTLMAAITQLVNAASVGTINVHLFKNDIVLSNTIQIADLEEADYSGYAPVAVEEAGSAWDDDDDNAVYSLGSAHFQGTTGAVQNLLYGYWVQADVTGVPRILVMERFDAPIPINFITDSIDVTPLVKIGHPQET